MRQSYYTSIDASVVAGEIAKLKTDDVDKLSEATGLSRGLTKNAIKYLQESNIPNCCGAKMFRLPRDRFPRLGCSLFCGRHRMWQNGKWINED